METLLLMLHPDKTRTQARKIPCLGQMEKKPKKLYMILCKIIQWLLQQPVRDFKRFQKSGAGREKHRLFLLKVKLQVKRAWKCNLSPVYEVCYMNINTRWVFLHIFLIFSNKTSSAFTVAQCIRTQDTGTSQYIKYMHSHFAVMAITLGYCANRSE